MYVHRQAAVRALRFAGLALANAWLAAAASAAILSTGDVKPPFALIDTPGSTKTFTVPIDPSSTNGGVYVGDLLTGALSLDNGWTLNSTFGVLANTTTSSTPSAAQLTLIEQSVWNTTGDFDVGRAAAATANLSGGSTLAVGGQTRLGTLAGASGQLSLGGNSTLSTGSLIVGDAGAGALASGLSSIEAGFIEAGLEAGSNGVANITGGVVHSAGGINIGIRGAGAINASAGATISSLFAGLGIDFDFLAGPSPASGVGVATLSGAGAAWSNGLGFTVAYNTRGDLSLSAGAALTTGYLEVARWGSDGQLRVEDSTLTVAKNPDFNDTPALIIGTEASSRGAAILDGATVAVQDGGFIEVARRSPSASLSMSSGATLTTQDALVATDAGAVGDVDISGAGSTFTANGLIEVGRFGKGGLSVQSGGAISSSSARIGLGDTSGGSAVHLSGIGSRWTTTDEMTVAEAGSASLTVDGGATVEVGSFLYLGVESGGIGALDVSGVGTAPDPPGGVVPSTVATASQIIVGSHGEGHAEVHAGGRLETLKAESPTASSGLIGRFADGEGSVVVKDAGSLWTGDGAINVGFMGAGSLSIEQGGRVESVDGVLARLPGSTGAATLTGAGSAWGVQHALYVGGRPATMAGGVEGQAGPGGAASLAIGAGAYVAAGSAIELFDGDVIDVSGGGSAAVGQGPPQAEAGAVHVYVSGRLAGSGIVQGRVVSDGVVAPGHSTGSLAIMGNYEQASGAELAIEVAGAAAGEFDALNVSGSAILAPGAGLAVQLANGFIPQAGDSFAILTAASVVGQFAVPDGLPTLAAGLAWRVAQLPTSVALEVFAPLPGDFDSSGYVDAADLNAWENGFGLTTTAVRADGDADGDADVDGADFLSWQWNLGAAPSIAADAAVPEPSAWLQIVTGLCAACGIAISTSSRRRSSARTTVRRRRARR
jgi:T5SS/PEP-CTERM-associated repeat protein